MYKIKKADKGSVLTPQISNPFEFEIVVNEPKGLHKIFDNLMIISNNVEPESFEVEITGDVYGFNKEKIFSYRCNY